MSEDRESLSRDDFAHAVRDSVNQTLSRYDHHPHHGYTPAAFRHYVRQIALLGALESIPFATALDVGCAEGYFMKIIRDRFGVDVWGVDLSTTALAKAHDLDGALGGGGRGARACRSPMAASISSTPRR